MNPAAIPRFEHVPRGTCEHPCPFYGECHCGCGEETNICKWTSPVLGRVGGRPFTWLTGHQRRLARKCNHEDRRPKWVDGKLYSYCRVCATNYERKRIKDCEPWRKDWEPKRVALFIKLTINQRFTVDEALKLLDKELPMPQERRGARGKVNA